MFLQGDYDLIRPLGYADCFESYLITLANLYFMLNTCFGNKLEHISNDLPPTLTEYLEGMNRCRVIFLTTLI